MSVGIGNFVSAKRRRATVAKAGTPGSDVDFTITADEDGNSIPPSINVKEIIVVPHDGGSPPSARVTIWRLRLYSKAGRLVTDRVYDDDRYAQAASDLASYNTTEWQYSTLDGGRCIYGSVGIKTGETGATFTIGVEFER